MLFEQRQCHYLFFQQNHCNLSVIKRSLLRLKKKKRELAEHARANPLYKRSTKLLKLSEFTECNTNRTFGAYQNGITECHTK